MHHGDARRPRRREEVHHVVDQAELGAGCPSGAPGEVGEFVATRSPTVIRFISLTTIAVWWGAARAARSTGTGGASPIRCQRGKRRIAAASATRARPTGSGRSSADHTSALAARTAAAGQAASAAATASTRSCNSAPGTTSSTNPRVRGGGCEAGAGEDRVKRRAVADDPRQRLGGAAHRDHADARLGQRDRAVVGCEADVAVERELEPEADAVALHRDDHRRGHRLQQTPHVATPAGIAHREQAGRGAELAQVGTGREVVAGRAEHDRPHRLVDDQRGEQVAELVAHAHVVHVDRRVVESQLHHIGVVARRQHGAGSSAASSASRCPTAPSSDTARCRRLRATTPRPPTRRDTRRRGRRPTNDRAAAGRCERPTRRGTRPRGRSPDGRCRRTRRCATGRGGGAPDRAPRRPAPRWRGRVACTRRRAGRRGPAGIATRPVRTRWRGRDPSVAGPARGASPGKGILPTRVVDAHDVDAEPREQQTHEWRGPRGAEHGDVRAGHRRRGGSGHRRDRGGRRQDRRAPGGGEQPLRGLGIERVDRECGDVGQAVGCAPRPGTERHRHRHRGEVGPCRRRTRVEPTVGRAQEAPGLRQLVSLLHRDDEVGAR